MERGAAISPRWNGKFAELAPAQLRQRGGRRATCFAVGSLLSACSGFGGASDVSPVEMTSIERLAESMGGGVNNPAGADWSCLGAPPAATPNVAGSGNVRYSLVLRSLFGAPLNNVVARACQAADVNCATPLAETRGLTTEGFLAVDVPIGFAGFLEVEADAHVPTVYYMRKPVLRDTVDTQPLQPIPTAGVAQLAGLINVEVVSELALLSVAVVDCQGERAPGATFTNNLGGRAFYFIDGVPNVTATATDSQGLGGFVNVPLRLVEVSAELETDRRLIGSRTLLPRPGWIVGGQVRPPALPLD